MRYPKKLLRITDLTFILPDDFEGDFRDAVRVLADYMDDADIAQTISGQNPSTIASILEGNTKDSKICMRYGIFEADDEGNYNLK